jgi:hypothetical protein
MAVYTLQTNVCCSNYYVDIMNTDQRRIRALYFSGMYILSVYDNMATFTWELCLVEAQTEVQDTRTNRTFHVTFSCPVITLYTI